MIPGRTVREKQSAPFTSVDGDGTGVRFIHVRVDIFVEQCNDGTRAEVFIRCP